MNYPKQNTTELPPQALDYERVLIGSAIVVEGAIDVICDKTQADDFYLTSHRQVYQILKKMSDEREVIALDTVMHKAEMFGYPDLINTISEVANSMCTLENLDYYISEVKAKGTQRRLEYFGNRIRNIREKEIDYEKYLDAVDSEYQKARFTGVLSKVITAREMVSATIDNMEARHTGKAMGYKTGLKALDDIVGEFPVGDLIVLAGRPSQGKTAAAVTIMLNQAKLGVRVGFLSLEMSKVWIGYRGCAILSGLNLFKISHGMTARHETPVLMEAFNTIADLPLYIDDTPGITVMKARSVIRQMVSRYKIQIVYIDHLHKMDHRHDNPAIGVGRTTSALAATAKEFQIPIVLLSQLVKKKSDKKKDNRPTLDELRWSGDIEADADTVIFVHREEVYTKKLEEAGQAELIVAKQRNGPTGTADVRFEKSTAKLYEDGGF